MRTINANFGINNIIHLRDKMLNILENINCIGYNNLVQKQIIIYIKSNTLKLLKTNVLYKHIIKLFYTLMCC